MIAADTTDCSETAQFSKDAYVKAVLAQVEIFNPSYTLTIFTNKDLKTVLWHHQQYCCQNRINEKTCEGKLD